MSGTREDSGDTVDVSEGHSLGGVVGVLMHGSGVLYYTYRSRNGMPVSSCAVLLLSIRLP